MIQAQTESFFTVSFACDAHTYTKKTKIALQMSLFSLFFPTPSPSFPPPRPQCLRKCSSRFSRESDEYVSIVACTYNSKSSKATYAHFAPTQPCYKASCCEMCLCRWCCKLNAHFSLDVLEATKNNLRALYINLSDMIKKQKNLQ